MKKTLLTTLLALMLTLSATPLMAAMPFTDVKSSDWFYNQVQFVYDHSIFNGVSETQFAPNAPMTRAMFVTVLGRMSGIDEGYFQDDSIFKDVQQGEWYAPYIQWAYENNITKGMSADTFGVNEPVTREQMAKFLCTYADYASIKPIEVSLRYDFDDDMYISSWASSYVYQCQRYGLLTGREYNCFDALEGCTRAEVATVIKRLDSAAKGERLVVNYVGRSIPTFDSVTLNFCYFSGILYGDYIEFSFMPWADMFVYKYRDGDTSKYYDYLAAQGFVLIGASESEEESTWTLQKGDEYVILGFVTVDGEKYIAVGIIVEGGDPSDCDWCYGDEFD